MKRKLYIMIALLLLPMLTTAARDTVQVNTGCCEGNAFTIRIPVRFPASMSVKYEWYRNDTMKAAATLAPGGSKIIYTVPAGEAHGDSAVLYFRYSVGYEGDFDDGCAWTESVKYALKFNAAPAQPSDVAGSTHVCPNISGLTYSVQDVAGVAYEWAVPEDWTITAGQGSSSITATTGTAWGNISVTPYNSCGNGAPSPPLTVMANTSSMIAGSTVVCAGEPGLTYSVTDVANVSCTWSFPAGWTITAGQDSSSVTVTAGAVGGDISVTPSSGSCTGTLSVSVNTECICTTVIPGSSVTACDGVSEVGSVSVVDCGVGEVGAASVAACNGVSVTGTASVAACEGVSAVGSVSVAACSGVSAVGTISVAEAP